LKHAFDNEWLRAATIVVLSAPAIALALRLASPHAEPATALAQLVPGLVLGLFARRHPLLVGGAAGALAVLLAEHVPGDGAWSIAPGRAIAITLTLAVAALAGRALRHRYERGAASAR
jgi:hypothetical protein